MNDISYPEENLYIGIQRQLKTSKPAHTEPTDEAIRMNDFFNRVASHKEANSIIIHFNNEPSLIIRSAITDSLVLCMQVHKPEVALTKAICYYDGLDPVEIIF